MFTIGMYWSFNALLHSVCQCDANILSQSIKLLNQIRRTEGPVYIAVWLTIRLDHQLNLSCVMSTTF